MVFCALVAQLAEHIHGKDKVTSSILVEGSVFAAGRIILRSAAQELRYGEQETGDRKGSPSMRRLQAEELYHLQKPEEHPGKAGVQ